MSAKPYPCRIYKEALARGPRILVGDMEVRVTWPEFYASILPRGTVVHFRRRDGQAGYGVVVSRMYYDGVVITLQVSPEDEDERVTLLPGSGDRLRRVKRAEEYPYRGEYI